jgi:hypothetical protein
VTDVLSQGEATALLSLIRQFEETAGRPAEEVDGDIGSVKAKLLAEQRNPLVTEHQGIGTAWVCDKCGQPIGKNGVCNSGLHVGPGEEANGQPVSTVELVRRRKGEVELEVVFDGGPGFVVTRVIGEPVFPHMNGRRFVEERRGA